MPKQMEGREMRSLALKEIIDAVNAAVTKYHGAEASNLLKTDYCAGVMLYFFDSQYHAQSPAMRAIAFDGLASNLKHMTRATARAGWYGGLVLDPDYAPKNER